MTENKKIDRKTVEKTLAAVALVCIATLSGAFVPLSDDTYIHLGDVAVYAVAMLCPFSTAVWAAAVGCALADLLLGSAVYAIPTVIIKTVTVIAAVRLRRLAKTTEDGDLFVCFSGVVTIVGYCIAEFIITLIRGDGLSRAWSEAVGSLTFNTVQALAAAAVFMMLAGFIRKMYAKFTAPKVKKERRGLFARRKKESETETDEDDE